VIWTIQKWHSRQLNVGAPVSQWVCNNDKSGFQTTRWGSINLLRIGDTMGKGSNVQKKQAAQLRNQKDKSKTDEERKAAAEKAKYVGLVFSIQQQQQGKSI
jgi:hypothetical protein